MRKSFSCPFRYIFNADSNSCSLTLSNNLFCDSFPHIFWILRDWHWVAFELFFVYVRSFFCCFVCRMLNAPKCKYSLFTFCVSTEDGISYELNNQRLLVIYWAVFSVKYADIGYSPKIAQESKVHVSRSNVKENSKWIDNYIRAHPRIDEIYSQPRIKQT